MIVLKRSILYKIYNLIDTNIESRMFGFHIFKKSEDQFNKDFKTLYGDMNTKTGQDIR